MFDKSKQCVSSMTVEIDFLQKKHADSKAYDTDKMAAEVLQSFNNQAFSVGQQVLFGFNTLNTDSKTKPETSFKMKLSNTFTHKFKSKYVII